MKIYKQSKKDEILAYQRAYYRQNKDTAPCYKDRYIPRDRDKYFWRKYEKLLVSLLDNSNDINVNKDSQVGYDVIWNGLKIDVKASHKRPRRNEWCFNDKGRCDYNFVFCLSEKESKTESIISMYLIPSKQGVKKRVCITPNTYKQYLIEQIR